ncbi:hypothetical protein O6H91_13G032000 [Diphasiastrum complanatum]|uniref:Uncharacterized protein n=1 Tax=Diphasiastrum complanatum TaxID=34168 RepID=A0ACC2BTQ5_DIPCM|nr:hypothetical protein O6H91_13G032000 [Diphasiastrum complanatum]
MAIAMEVGWPASDLGGDSYPALIGKKRGWGDDQQKLLQLMMGPSSKEDTRITLDLLGGSSSASQQSQFLDLNPDVPLPSGWEKCLDLKSGSIYFVNWNTGITTTVDPRNSQFPLSKSSPSAATSHEFLHTMQSATLKLINPSSELKCEEDAKPWKEKLRFSDLMKKPLESGDLELNLNLSMTNESDDERMYGGKSAARTCKISNAENFAPTELIFQISASICIRSSIMDLAASHFSSDFYLFIVFFRSLCQAT